MPVESRLRGSTFSFLLEYERQATVFCEPPSWTAPGYGVLASFNRDLAYFIDLDVKARKRRPSAC